MTRFSTFRLDRSRVCEALPLVRMAIAVIDQHRWLEYCEHLIRLDGGVLVVTAGDGGIHGLAAYHPEDDLRLGTIIRVVALVAFELNRANPVRQALCDALDALCDSMDAHGVLLMVSPGSSPDPGSNKARSWESAGFCRYGAALWKPRRLALGGAASEVGRWPSRFSAVPVGCLPISSTP
jgi:hypothetical protein